MKAKQKARKLVKAHLEMLSSVNPLEDYFNVAIKSALLCIDEMIKEQNSEFMKHRVQYWEEVKNEIEKI